MSTPPPTRVHRLAVLWFAGPVGTLPLVSAVRAADLRPVDHPAQVVQRVIEDYRGRLLADSGNAVLAEFASTDLALHAALALQAGFATHFAPASMLRLRIAVHIGDVATAADRSVGGEGVDTAAHLHFRAPPGGVVVSGDVWRQLRQRPEFRFRALREGWENGCAAPVPAFAATLREEGGVRRGATGSGGLDAPPHSARPEAPPPPLHYWPALLVLVLAAVLAGVLLLV